MLETRIQLTQQIKKLLIDRLNLNLSESDISNDTVLFGEGLNLDSIDALQLVVALETEMKLTLSDDQLSVLRSVNTLVDYLLEKTEANPPKIPLQSVVESEDYKPLDLDSKNHFLNSYRSIRETVGLTHKSNISVLRITGSEALAVLDRLITGNIQQLPDNHVLPSLVLQENGRVALSLEVFNLGNDYLLVTGSQHLTLLIDSLRTLSSALLIQDESSLYTLLQLDGPHSVPILEQCLGPDVIGLRLRMIAKIIYHGKEIYIIRHNSTGEDGYQIYLDPSHVTLLVDDLNKISESLIVQCMPEVHTLLSVEACSFDELSFFPHQESPFSAGLHWMIDIHKEGFIGQKALLETYSSGISHRRVPFQALETLPTLYPDQALYLKDKKIGYISATAFSPQLNQQIGYAYIETAYAWPGVRVGACPDEYSLELISAPFILPYQVSKQP